ncbi:hypothetical protein PAAG_00786 [Paracoccidioides lutzii Pb01]|uniref:Uncharacterized protein n=1 Tax=Paracoccidioides lutzii (strain ATCC MYA-826 / Pb01) TaxID=502779 RepID=C1GQJ1_PARBA|nr:hypothetical protein PAAG_00786 [Paracoccidioides lutzii Pb01]EEH37865.1 hypothetical protein PAAG_00786 [Paracoccidioides lutzii Pb01]
MCPHAPRRATAHETSNISTIHGLLTSVPAMAATHTDSAVLAVDQQLGIDDTPNPDASDVERIFENKLLAEAMQSKPSTLSYTSDNPESGGSEEEVRENLGSQPMPESHRHDTVYGTTVDQGKRDEARSWAKYIDFSTVQVLGSLSVPLCYSAQNCQANPPGGPSPMIGGGEEVVEDHGH